MKPLLLILPLLILTACHMPTDPAAISTPPGNTPAAPAAPPALTAAAPQNPGLVQGMPGNAPAAPVVPPAPPSPVPQDAGAVVTPVAAPIAATATIGTGDSAVVLTARAPGVDGNTIYFEIVSADGRTDFEMQSYISLADDPNGDTLPPHPCIIVYPVDYPSARPQVTMTVPAGASASANAIFAIGGIPTSLGGPWTAATLSAAIERAAAIAGLLELAMNGTLSITHTDNAIVIGLLAGASGNNMPAVLGGTTNGCVLSSHNFWGGVDGATTTAADVAAALNAIPNGFVTATGGPGAVVCDFGTLGGGVGLAAPPDVRWPRPVPAPQNPGTVQAASGNTPAAPAVPPAATEPAPQTPGPILSISGNAPPPPASITP